jgi:hypothetical protein
MADQPRIKSNTFFQKQNHLKLKKEEKNKSVIFDAAVQRAAGLGLTISAAGGVSYTALYAANGFDPQLVADFASGFYAQDGAASDFETLFAATTEATSNGTMVDSDGLLKWRPHNLLLQSENFTASWGAAAQGDGVAPTITENAGVAPDGTTTADRVQCSRSTASGPNRSRVQQSITLSQTISGKMGVWLKSYDGTASGVTLMNASSADVNSKTVATLTSEWQFFDISWVSSASDTQAIWVGLIDGDSSDLTADFLIWGAHAYRSDLGGMVDNPARGDSYVPTTTAARYLPRLGHHKFAGTHTLGPELVTNGTFDSDISGVSDASSAGGSIVWNASGYLDLVNATGTARAAIDGIPVEAGARYRVSYEVVDLGGSAGVPIYLDGAGSSSNAGSSVGVKSFDYVATGATLDISIRNFGAGTTVSIDNVSVRKLNPDYVNKGVLVESEARTNLFVQSDPNAADWLIFVSRLIKSKDVVGPDGVANSATTLTNTIANFCKIKINATVATSTAYTFSGFFKAGTLDWVLLYTAGFTTPAPGGVYFDLANGSVGTANTGYTGRIEDFGNGWYRCCMTFTTDASDTSGSCEIYPAEADGDISLPAIGETIAVYGLQFEAGSTPSSLIVTNGATVTRTADTNGMGIAAALMPDYQTPNVIGDELVTNGDFGDGDTGWTLSVATTVSGGTAIMSGAATYKNLFRNVAAPGPVQISYDVVSVTTTGFLRARLGGANGRAREILTPGTYTDIVYNTGTQAIVLETTGSNTFEGTVDNISVREIDPLAVSIAVKGEINYSDEDAFGTARFINWEVDGSNRILMNLDTDGANTGNIVAFQQEGGTLDTNSTDVLSPGINVPFSAAARHGSTFVQLATDGTAVGANLTPTALIDLSAANFMLARDFMGTVESVIVWPVDIGDTGIEQSSS